MSVEQLSVPAVADTLPDKLIHSEGAAEAAAYADIEGRHLLAADTSGRSVLGDEKREEIRQEIDQAEDAAAEEWQQSNPEKYDEEVSRNLAKFALLEQSDISLDIDPAKDLAEAERTGKLWAEIQEMMAPFIVAADQAVLDNAPENNAAPRGERKWSKWGRREETEPKVSYTVSKKDEVTRVTTNYDITVPYKSGEHETGKFATGLEVRMYEASEPKENDPRIQLDFGGGGVRAVRFNSAHKPLRDPQIMAQIESQAGKEPDFVNHRDAGLRPEQEVWRLHNEYGMAVGETVIDLDPASMSITNVYRATTTRHEFKPDTGRFEASTTNAPSERTPEAKTYRYNKHDVSPEAVKQFLDIITGLIPKSPS